MNEIIQIQEGQLQFKIHGKLHTVNNDIPPNTSLNYYIRNYTHFKGTKFMCLEGGCGVCIVAIKRADPLTGKEELIAVNSCLVPIFSCYGWNIITIEGIGNTSSGLNKIQSTLASINGSQCGYCSSGMLMNMFSLLNGKENVTMAEIENSFSGNICRCTGYRAILDAFKSFGSDAPKPSKSKIVDIEDIMSQVKICPKTSKKCDNTCQDDKDEQCDIQIPDISLSIVNAPNNAKWFRVKSISEIFQILEINTVKNYMILAGNTAQGAYRVTQPIDTYIDVNSVKDLHSYTITNDQLVIGANTTLNKAIDLFNNVATNNTANFAYLKQVAYHISLVANVSVRNIGTIAGNLSTKYAHNDFQSDIFTLLEAVNAMLTTRHITGITNMYTPQQYLTLNMDKKIITNITFPALDSSYVFNSYKIMQRAQGTPAYVNAAFLFKVDPTNKYKVLEAPNLVYGGISASFVHATKTEQYLVGHCLLDEATLKQACQSLQSEVKPSVDPTGASTQYRQALAINLFYKFVLNLSPSAISTKNRSGGSILSRPLSSGQHDFQTDKSLWPDTEPIPKLEAFRQVSGETEYTNDMPNFTNEVYGALVVTKLGPGTLSGVDISQAEKVDGFVRFICAKDIPGQNIYSIGTAPPNAPYDPETLFITETVEYAGQPVGVVIAKTQTAANIAADNVVVNIIPTTKPVLYSKDVVASGDTSRIVLLRQQIATKKKDDIKYTLEGTFDMLTQYHFTMETQTCICVPTEDGIDVYPASQWITVIQENISAALGIPMNSVNIMVKRLGGAFGHKLGRSAIIATACAVAANTVKQPVRMVMKLETNMEAIGKRWPVYNKYSVAVDGNGVIQTLTANVYVNHGAHKNDFNEDLLLLSIVGLYDAQTWNINCYGVKTDITAYTYCRAPGSTEAISICECIMDHIAKVTNQDPLAVRIANLNPQYPDIPGLIDDIKTTSELVNRKALVDAFNQANRWKKRGISVAGMNYIHALIFSFHSVISVYAFDGTISITHGGIETGQGLNTKVAQAAAYALGVDLSLIKVKATNILTAVNDGCTADSNATDGVVYATLQCCQILLTRLQPIKSKFPGSTWQQIILQAFLAGVDLFCEYGYSPVLNPIEYNIFGMAVAEVEVDLLTGQHQILRVDILEDVGQSINPLIDLGQVEGAYIMGLGYWLLERIIYDQNTGAVLTNRTWNYTPPQAKDIPIDFRVYFRRNAKNPNGVLNAKVTGEPATTMAIGLVLAIRNALDSGRMDASAPNQWFQLNTPYTPENVYLSSLTSADQFSL